jgi:hypothetical protein
MLHRRGAGSALSPSDRGTIPRVERGAVQPGSTATCDTPEVDLKGLAAAGVLEHLTGLEESKLGAVETLAAAWGVSRGVALARLLVTGREASAANDTARP